MGHDRTAAWVGVTDPPANANGYRCMLHVDGDRYLLDDADILDLKRQTDRILAATRGLDPDTPVRFVLDGDLITVRRRILPELMTVIAASPSTRGMPDWGDDLIDACLALCGLHATDPGRPHVPIRRIAAPHAPGTNHTGYGRRARTVGRAQRMDAGDRGSLTFSGPWPWSPRFPSAMHRACSCRSRRYTAFSASPLHRFRISANPVFRPPCIRQAP